MSRFLLASSFLRLLISLGDDDDDDGVDDDDDVKPVNSVGVSLARITNGFFEVRRQKGRELSSRGVARRKARGMVDNELKLRCGRRANRRK